MKVTVTKYLNVRVGKASLNAPCYQYLAPGSELEVDGNLYTGDKYDGNDQWYKDEAGNYYWSGGAEVNEIFKAKELDQLLPTELFKILNLKISLPKGNGSNINIGILDSGIDLKYPNYKKALIQYGSKDFIEESLNNSHGTMVAGLIIGDGIKIKGLAALTRFRFTCCN